LAFLIYNQGNETPPSPTHDERREREKRRRKRMRRKRRRREKGGERETERGQINRSLLQV
jgi:hypothetical protein